MSVAGRVLMRVGPSGCPRAHPARRASRPRGMRARRRPRRRHAPVRRRRSVLMPASRAARIPGRVVASASTRSRASVLARRRSQMRHRRVELRTRGASPWTSSAVTMAEKESRRPASRSAASVSSRPAAVTIATGARSCACSTKRMASRRDDESLRQPRGELALGAKRHELDERVVAWRAIRAPTATMPRSERPAHRSSYASSSSVTPSAASASAMAARRLLRGVGEQSFPVQQHRIGHDR